MAILLAATPGAIAASAFDAAKLPPPAQVRVDFTRDIRPIFEAQCYRCHGSERPKSRFELDTRSTALKGGEHGIDIIAGQSAKSPLVYYVARVVEDMEMPPSGKGQPLTHDQVSLLRAWIDQGANWSDEASAKTRSLFSVEPSFGWIGVSGDRDHFREQWGLNDGWSGGLREFKVQEQSTEGIRLNAEGRLLPYQNDYRVKVNLEKRDLGFVQLGFEQYRKYYDDTGGFYEPFGNGAFSLNRDLYLDIGKAWFDVGLTLPHFPRIVLGYEYQFKDGTKSSLAWSDVAPPAALPNADPRAIFPNYKQLEERTHILKLDVSHEYGGVRLEDNLRVEFYDLDAGRVESSSASAGAGAPDSATLYQENYHHIEAVNTLRAVKQLKDWLLLGGGYLYSKLNGDAGFNVEAFLPSSQMPFGPPIDASNPIVLRRESHVGNLSSLWGPWDGLTLSAGVQNEWTHEEGAGQGLVQVLNPGQPGIQHIYSSYRDKVIVEEDIGLRYTKIPFTVLFADGRLRQEWISHFERDQNSPSGFDFLRDTDATLRVNDLRTGFNISPWTKVSLDANYHHTWDKTAYDHKLDTSPVPLDPTLGLIPGAGYPAFFRRRDLETDQVEARLVVHPAPWIKTSLKYQLAATDYTTVTESTIDLGTGQTVPGGSIFAGNYDVSTYSLNTTLTPWRRLNLSTTFSYSNSRTVTGVNGRAGLVPYEGDIYSVLSSANFIITKSTDWTLAYTFSRADYSQNNEVDGLPLGINYDSHALITGISHRFSPKITANFQYGFFAYAEPSSGGTRDYTAHAVFASVKILFD